MRLNHVLKIRHSNLINVPLEVLKCGTIIIYPHCPSHRLLRGDYSTVLDGDFRVVRIVECVEARWRGPF
jgi:hypothetical protein